MTEKVIKPIPKYIERLIEKTDKQLHEQNGFVRFYAYLTKQKNELIKVTVPCVTDTRNGTVSK